LQRCPLLFGSVLNAEKVPPPRVYAKRRRVGWKDTTIRAMLHNESYAGTWRYKSTSVRRYTKRAEASVIVQDRPHLRIVGSVDDLRAGPYPLTTRGPRKASRRVDRSRVGRPRTCSRASSTAAYAEAR
jgi:hypothetical protein